MKSELLPKMQQLTFGVLMEEKETFIKEKYDKRNLGTDCKESGDTSEFE